MDSNKPINLTLAISDVEVIVQALADLPLKIALGPWLRVRQQAQAQITEAERAGSGAPDRAEPETSASPPAPVPDAPARTATNGQEQHHDP